MIKIGCKMVDMRNTETTSTQLKGDTMDKRQTITEGCVVYIAGHEMVATDVRVEIPTDPITGIELGSVDDDVARVTFVGTFTASRRNDRDRHTLYNRSRYGGNRLAYIF